MFYLENQRVHEAVEAHLLQAILQRGIRPGFDFPRVKIDQPHFLEVQGRVLLAQPQKQYPFRPAEQADSEG